MHKLCRYSGDANWGVLDRSAHWHNLANTIELSVCGGEAALCHITLTTCCTQQWTYFTCFTKFQLRSQLYKAIGSVPMFYNGSSTYALYVYGKLFQRCQKTNINSPVLFWAMVVNKTLIQTDDNTQQARWNSHS